MTAPCKNCGDREIGCHSKCEKYRTFREPLDKAAIERNNLRKVYEVYDKEQVSRQQRNKLQQKQRRKANG